MIEKTVLNMLAEFDCYLERPVKAPKEWVLMERISQTAVGKGLVYETRFAFRCMSESLLKAVALSERVKAALFGAENNRVTAVRMVGSANMTDPETREYCYQVVFDLVHY